VYNKFTGIKPEKGLLQQLNDKIKEDVHFKKYYSRLRLEATLKSLLLGGVISFSLTFVTALVTWFLLPAGFWIALGLFIPGTAGLTALFYFLKYRPTTVANARRLDRLGLEERLVTMIEYQNDDSFMAAVQRADAKATLDKVEASDIKMILPRKVLILASVLLVLGLGMTVTNGLSYFGVIPSGMELFKNATAPEDAKYVMAEYKIRNDEQGYLLGEEQQLILKGGDAKIVIAIANDGYTFDGWTDGVKTPARVDKDVTENLEVFAIFSETGDNLKDDDGDGDEPDDLPPGSGEGDDGNDPSSDSPAKYETYNQFIDGETYYRELLELYRDDIIDYLDSYGSEMTPEERAIIEAYIGIV